MREKYLLKLLETLETSGNFWRQEINILSKIDVELLICLGLKDEKLEKTLSLVINFGT